MQQPKAWPGFETTHHHTAPQAPPMWRAPAGPEGLAAVPVGGGRARAGLEIDHSERSSRVAISRAGRRPRTHTATRPEGAREHQRCHPGTPKGRVPKYPPLVGSLSHCLVEAQAE